jgi:hypothetical protein
MRKEDGDAARATMTPQKITILRNIHQERFNLLKPSGVLSLSKTMASRKKQRSPERNSDTDGSPPQPSQKKSKRQTDESSQIVRLNVGGTRYEVARDTLMRYEESMLASLISGK